MSKEKKFVFVGRLDKLKGIGIILKAWKLMGGGPKLLVCGTGPLENDCKAYINENKLDSVEMMGFVPNAEARRLVASSKALILPSQWYEGFPMAIVEAYSVGTPVLGSGMGNVGNLVEDGITGWKFKPYNSAEEISGTISRVLSSHFSVSQLRKLTVEYMPDANLKKLETIYSSIRGDL